MSTETIATLLMPLSDTADMADVEIISCRFCPALQDVEGNIASILSHSCGKSQEEVMCEHTNTAGLPDLQDTRCTMFSYAIGAIEEANFDNDITLNFKLKQRRGAKAASSVALDIVHLFNYICGASDKFPASVLVYNGVLNAFIAPTTQPSPPPQTNSGPQAGAEILIPTPVSQGVPCAQPGRSTSSPVPSDGPQPPSHIGSPFLDDAGASPNEASQRSLSPISITDLSKLSDSIVISDGSAASASHVDRTEPFRDPTPTCCCDHGRAIIDLRCTLDLMQFQITEMLRQFSDFTRQKSHMTVGFGAHCGMQTASSGDNNEIPPSPPDSRVISPNSTETSLSPDNEAFNEILSIATPTRLGETNQSNAPGRDGDGMAACFASQAATTTTPTASDQADFLQSNYVDILNEIQSLRTNIVQVEDRVADSEMRSVTNSETLNNLVNLPKSNRALEKEVKSVRFTADKNSKKITSLRKKMSKPTQHNGKCVTKTIAAVETSNRFAPLMNDCTGDKKKCEKKTKCKSSETKTVKKAIRKGNDNHDKCKVKIIGASLVRGQAQLVTDHHKGIEACCFPCPGATAEKIQKRAPGMINKHDDVVVVLGGTNNVPVDDVATWISKIGSLIRTVRQQNENADIVISEIPKIFDDESLNHNIDKINVFVKHVCTKSERLHAMKLEYLSRSHFGRDGLHFSKTGKLRFAKSIQSEVEKLMLKR